MKFQHNRNIEINKNSYRYVFLYKKQLLYNITKLLDNLNIRFVISHGNLIEYERQKFIYHDDDLDIRMDINDLEKWSKFCNENNMILPEYNLKFDHRFKKIDSQLINGIQCKLINFYNKYKIPVYKMDIHCDLVANIVNTNFWMDYIIDYNNLRKIVYLGVSTYAPNKNDTVKVLQNQYGKNYIIPDKPAWQKTSRDFTFKNATSRRFVSASILRRFTRRKA